MGGRGHLPVGLLHLGKDAEYLLCGRDVADDLDVDGLVGEGQLLEHSLETIETWNRKRGTTPIVEILE
jgi:hypothetical protein